MGKIIIRIIVIAAFVVAAVAQYQKNQTINALRQENADLKAQTAQIAPLQEQVARAAQEAASAGSMQTQLHELARLRGEVQRLRSQTNALAQTRQELQTLQQQVESVTEANRDQAAALQAQTRKSQGEQAVNACINNLRLIDAAKQQWALENRKQNTDTPTMDDLRPYLGHGPNGELPICPEGGVYTVGTVAEKPTCNIPGHVLP